MDMQKNLTAQEKERLMNEVQQEVAILSTQEIISKMVDKCFKKCIGVPGTALDSTEKKCIAMCMDRFMDSMNIVSKTYVKRLQKENANR